MQCIFQKLQEYRRFRYKTGDLAAVLPKYNLISRFLPTNITPFQKRLIKFHYVFMKASGIVVNEYVPPLNINIKIYNKTNYYNIV